ncbi:hypothetical protein ACWEP4_32160 [Streptomyces sp. NPDC004227]
MRQQVFGSPPAIGWAVSGASSRTRKLPTACSIWRVVSSQSPTSPSQKPHFSWNEADVLNWSTKKPYDF